MNIRIVTYILYYFKYLTTNDDKREKTITISTITTIGNKISLL